MKRIWIVLLCLSLFAGACKGCGKGDGVEIGDLVVENCDNGEDDDENGLVDCEEEVCQLQAVCVTVPPDPSDLAPDYQEGFTSFADSVRFLFEGENRVVFGLDPESLDESRIAVVRGRVVDADGNPVSGLRASIAGQSGLGYTYSRADGAIDLVANGGAPVTVRFEGEGFPAVDRTLEAPQLDFAHAEPIVATPYDEKKSTIDLRKGGTHVATIAGDEDGERAMRMFFRADTTAELVLPDGRNTELREITVRATEFTVGDTGMAAMPAVLPAESAYTYAAELSVDEAQRAGATTVRFDRPVTLFLDNFLELPAGTVVPNGVYDRQARTWIPTQNGVVATRIGDGIDITGDGRADSGQALEEAGYGGGIGKAAAELFDDGETFWLVNVDHFSPYDLNFPYEFPEDAIDPDTIPDFPETEEDDPCEEDGSIIECENQVLGKALIIPGTDLTLNYRSDRVVGRGRSLEVTLTGDEIPASLEKVTVDVEVGGQYVREEFAPEPNLEYQFTWDGTDAYGREVPRRHLARVRVGYWYEVQYTEPAGGLPAFGATGTAELRGGRLFLPRTVIYEGELGTVDSRKVFTTGGWQLSGHHAFDGNRSTLYRAGLPERKGADVGRVVRNYETFEHVRDALPLDPWEDAAILLFDMARYQDDSLLLSFSTNVGSRVLVRRHLDGTYEHVAGHPSPTQEEVVPCMLSMSDCNAGRAPEDAVVLGSDIVVGPDDTVYLPHGRCVYRITDTLEPIAGDCLGGEEPDGPSFPHVDHLTVGPEGELYAANSGRIYRLFEGERRVEILAGGCTSCEGVRTDGPADAVELSTPEYLTASSDGSLYFAESYPETRIRRLTPSGMIETVWQGSEEQDVRMIAAAPDGSIYFLEVDGVSSTYISRLVGGVAHRQVGASHDTLGADIEYFYEQALLADNVPASSVLLIAVTALAVDDSGRIIYTTYGGLDRPDVDGAVPLVKVAEQAYGDVGAGADVLLPSLDASLLHRFDAQGRILDSRHALFKGTVRAFAYDEAGRLSSVTHRDRSAISIERDAQGRLAAIVAPGGTRTEFELDANGYITEIRYPDGAIFKASYDDGGLLTSWTDARGNTSQYSYDRVGRLVEAVDPEGDFKRLTRTKDGVMLETSSGRSVVHGRDESSWYIRESVTTDSAGLQWHTKTQFERGRTLTRPDRTVLHTVTSPDPRFGYQSLYTAVRSTKVPSGLEQHVERQREYTYADPGDRSSVALRQETTVVNGETWTTEWDAQAGTRTTTSPEGRVRVERFDELGRLVSRQVGSYAPLEIERESGHVSQVRHGDHWLRFDWSGDHLTGMSTSGGESVAYGIDGAGRANTIEKNGQTWHYTFDANGNLVSASSPEGVSNSYGYDGRDTLASWAFSGLDATTQATDIDRRPLWVEQPDGDQVTWEYDEAGRNTSVITDQGTVERSYDPETGKLSRVATEDVVSELTWDGFLLKASRHRFGPADVTVERAFDDNFRTTQRTIAGATISYEHDRDGFVTKAGPMSVERASAGEVVATEVGRVRHENSYDPVHGHLMGERYLVDANELFAYTLTRNAQGRIIERVETVEGVTTTLSYEYDGDGHLVAVRRDGVQTESYTWEGEARRMLANGEAAGYDANHRLVSQGDVALSYGRDGNVASVDDADGLVTFTYDALGQVRGGSDAGGAFSIGYDGLGRRAAIFRGTSFERGFVYDDFRYPVAEVDASGNVRSRFVYLTHTHVPDLMLRSGRTYRLVTDYLGTVRMVVDTASGDVVQRADYDAFGNPMTQTAPDFQPFGWAGGMDLGIGNILAFPGRFYDPRLGRWYQPDPRGISGGGIDLFAYVHGDPINYFDPTGEAIWFVIVPVAVGLVATLGAGQVHKRANEVSRDALDKWEKDRPEDIDTGGHNGPGDAIKHCAINCDGSRTYGNTLTRFFSWANEEKYTLHGQKNPPDEEKMDYHNNACGRELAEKEPQKDCYELCRDAYLAGELEVLPEARWGGP